MYDTRYDGLFAGDFPVVTEEITIVAGEAVVRGNLLIQGEDGYTVADTDIETSESVVCVASEDVEAADAAVSIGYFAGEFDADKIILKDGTPAAGSIDILRDKSIYLKKVIKSGTAE